MDAWLTMRVYCKVWWAHLSEASGYTYPVSDASYLQETENEAPSEKEVAWSWSYLIVFWEFFLFSLLRWLGERVSLGLWRYGIASSAAKGDVGGWAAYLVGAVRHRTDEV